MGLVLQYKFSVLLPGISKKIKGCNSSLGPDKWNLGWLAGWLTPDFSQNNLNLHVVQTKEKMLQTVIMTLAMVQQVEECKYAPCGLICSQIVHYWGLKTPSRAWDQSEAAILKWSRVCLHGSSSFFMGHRWCHLQDGRDGPKLCSYIPGEVLVRCTMSGQLHVLAALEMISYDRDMKPVMV